VTPDISLEQANNREDFSKIHNKIHAVKKIDLMDFND